MFERGVKRKAANCHAFKMKYRLASYGHHALHLMVFPFKYCDKGLVMPAIINYQFGWHAFGAVRKSNALRKRVYIGGVKCALYLDMIQF